jgi:hypothetical protein
MADPIVHITNGIPDTGTGNITTLGQTLLDGANLTLGATTDAVATGAGTINAHLRALASTVSGSALTVAWTGTPTISGTVTANQGSPPWSMKPDGTVWTQTGTSANVNLTNASVAVTGTFWQATQPVSGTVTVTQGTAANLNATVTGSVSITGTPTISGAVTSSSATTPVSTMNSASAATGQNAAMAACFDDTTPTAITENNFGYVRMSANRNQYTTIRDAAGNERGVNVSSGNALLVDASATTQPVSGTVTVQQATSSNLKGQVDPLTIGSWGLASNAQNTAAPTNGELILGQFLSAPATLTNALTSPLLLDSSGNLKVNVAAGGGSGGTSSTFGAAFPATGTAVGAKDSTGTNMAALNLDASGNLKVAVTGAGSGGTSSTDEAAFTAGTSAFTPAGGFFQTTATSNALTTGQMGAWQMTANRAGFVNLRNASGTEIGTTAAPIRDAPDGTIWTLTGTSANINVTNASIPVTQSGTWNINAITTLPALPANQSVNVAQINGVTPLMGNGVTGTGSQRVTIASDNTAFSVNAVQSGTWNIGTLTSITNTVNVASATAPASTMNSASATGGIASAMAAVFDDVTPTAITENNFGYVRMSANRNQYTTIRDAAGNERGVNVSVGNALLVDASATTQPVSGTVTVTQGTAANLNATVTGTVAATQSGNWTSRIVGNTGAALDTGAGQNTAMPTNMLMVGGEFNTSPTAITSGNASPLQLNGSGSLRVDGSGATQPVSGTVAATQSGTWTVQPGNTANTTAWLVTGTGGTFPATQSGTWNITNISGTVSLPTGAATSANQPTNAAIASTTAGQTGYLAMGAVTTGAPTYTTAQTNPLSLDTSGNLRIIGTVTANQSGTWVSNITQFGGTNISTGTGASGTGIPRVTVSNDSNVLATQSGTWTVQQGTPPWTVNGDTASGATDANNPVKIGGLGKTTNPTAVTDGQRVAAVFDKQGKQVVVGAIRQLKGVQKTSITVATETTVVTAGGAGVLNDVYAIVVTNKSATSVFVDFKDATAGTTRMTLAAPANDTRGFTVPVDSAMVQAVAANNWTATVSSAVTSIEITMLYVSNL